MCCPFFESVAAVRTCRRYVGRGFIQEGRTLRSYSMTRSALGAFGGSGSPASAAFFASLASQFLMASLIEVIATQNTTKRRHAPYFEIERNPRNASGNAALSALLPAYRALALAPTSSAHHGCDNLRANHTSRARNFLAGSDDDGYATV